MPEAVDKSQIIEKLLEMADLMELESDNPFRARAFRNAARVLESLNEDLGALIEEGRLESVRGIGESIAHEIISLYREGSSPRLRELEAAVPRGVRDLLRVPGLGPKRIRALWQKLGVTSIDALRRACEEGRIAELEGFGERSQEKILNALAYMESISGRFLIPEVEPYVEGILAHFDGFRAVKRIEVAGSYRRRRETVKDLDVVVATVDPEKVSKHFLEFRAIRDVVAHGHTKTSVRLENGLAVDLRVVRPEEFPSALCYFTGSKEHNTALRARAKERGYKLNEYGLFKGDTALELQDEADIYEELDLAYIPPELRENMGEIELAEQGKLPRLLEEKELRGVLHVHTTYSDGHATLEEMAEEARSRGYRYIGICDHSQSAYYAGGLKEEDIRRQHEEIDRLNRRWRDFRIFKGIESDIRPDGSLDYPPEVLDRFEFVVASLHSGLNLPRDQQTERVLRALKDPHTTILGHITARLLLRREGVAMDVEKVLRAAAESGVAVEINANPRRLELDWRYGPLARELKLRTAIDPDAHSREGIGDMRYGVGIARKAGFSPAHVVNTYTAKDFAKFCAQRRKQKG